MAADGKGQVTCPHVFRALGQEGDFTVRYTCVAPVIEGATTAIANALDWDVGPTEPFNVQDVRVSLTLASAPHTELTWADPQARITMELEFAAVDA